MSWARTSTVAPCPRDPDRSPQPPLDAKSDSELARGDGRIEV